MSRMSSQCLESFPAFEDNSRKGKLSEIKKEVGEKDRFVYMKQNKSTEQL